METKTQSAGHGVSFLHNQARHFYSHDLDACVPTTLR